MNNNIKTTLQIGSDVDLTRDFAKLDARYDAVADYVENIAKGELRSLIVRGRPGVGKTAMINQFLTSSKPRSHKIVTGHMTNLSLYDALYRHKEKGQVLVLDDVDSVFSQVEGLNLLKAAMDTTETRNISWESSKVNPGNLGLPANFKFEGGVILITNVGFGYSKRGKAGVHLMALIDRSYNITIGDDTPDMAFKQIAYMVRQKNMLSQFNLSLADENMLLDYVADNINELPNLSLRTMVKLAEVYSLSPANWQNKADVALLS
tara:strand:- start:1870 stop:2658 length:789 start_codon:yes stop_codon:yes gene_type:complete